MKKILIALMLSLLTIIAVSQVTLTLKAHTYNFGIKNEMGEGNSEDIVWVGEQPIGIMVVMSDHTMAIYSEYIQRYTTQELIVKNEGQYTWLASDDKNGRCHLSIVSTASGECDIMIVIEYLDSVWYYVCSKVSDNLSRSH